MIAIAIGFLGVVIATRPGTAAFQPIVLIAIAGVVCNFGYVLATRKLAGADAAQTTLAWTQVAGIVFRLRYCRGQRGTAGAWLVMAAMGVFGAAGHGLLIVAHRFAPAPALTPFTYTQLVWMIVSGALVSAWRGARAPCFWVYAYPAFLRYAAHSAGGYWARILPQASEIAS